MEETIFAGTLFRSMSVRRLLRVLVEERVKVPLLKFAERVMVTDFAERRA